MSLRVDFGIVSFSSKDMLLLLSALSIDADLLLLASTDAKITKTRQDKNLVFIKFVGRGIHVHAILIYHVDKHNISIKDV